MSWRPVIWAAVLAIVYVLKEAPGAYIDYRVLVLRVAALLVCMGAAFVLDDPTEETIGHVPTRLLLRRGVRVALLLPVAAGTWAVLVHFAGDVTRREGGPLPVGDLTLEAATILLIALSAACLGARLTSDRLGGIAAAPIVLAIVALAMFLPADQKLILGSASDPRWEDVHEVWRFALVGAALAFLYLNRSSGAYRTASRLRALKAAPRTV
jgi:UDP-N-acetylmuramyl pentapeptide phosphotransferase/UDP-N-acetylglucosamine-1-phosphate transferase